MSGIVLPNLHAGQRAVVKDSARFNVLQCGRRVGKTTLGEWLGAHTAIEAQPVGWFAPTYKYLTEPYGDLERRLEPILESSNRSEKKLTLSNGGSIEFWSLEDENAGRSRKYKRVIVDESGFVKNLRSSWEFAIRPTLADLGGDAWFLGTPHGRRYFHQLFVKGQNGERGWKSFRLETADNPHIPPSEVEAARRDLPEDVFDQEFRGIPAADEGCPFSIAAIKACTVEGTSDEEPVVWGVDLAKSHDWSVAIGLDEHGAVSRFFRWQSDWKATIERLTNIVGEIPATIDATGVGDPIVEELQSRLPCVEGFKFTQQSKQELMLGLASAIQCGNVSFPAGPIVDELECFQYEYTANSVRYSAPEGMHDDCVCALALAVHCNRTAPSRTFDFRVIG